MSFDGQGLVRVPRTGEMAVDADFDPALLPPLTVLKLAQEEAEIVADGPFEARHAAVLNGVLKSDVFASKAFHVTTGAVAAGTGV